MRFFSFGCFETFSRWVVRRNLLYYEDRKGYRERRILGKNITAETAKGVFQQKPQVMSGARIVSLEKPTPQIKDGSTKFIKAAFELLSKFILIKRTGQQSHILNFQNLMRICMPPSFQKGKRTLDAEFKYPLYKT